MSSCGAMVQGSGYSQSHAVVAQTNNSNFKLIKDTGIIINLGA